MDFLICFARHDFHDDHGGNRSFCNGMGLMSYGARPDAWTDCNNRDFEAWYRSRGFACLPKHEAPFLSCGPDLPEVRLYENDFCLSNYSDSSNAHPHSPLSNRAVQKTLFAKTHFFQANSWITHKYKTYGTIDRPRCL